MRWDSPELGVLYNCLWILPKYLVFGFDDCEHSHNTFPSEFMGSQWAKWIWSGNACEVKTLSHWSHLLLSYSLSFSIHTSWGKGWFPLNFRRSGRGSISSGFAKPSESPGIIVSSFPHPPPALPLVHDYYSNIDQRALNSTFSLSPFWFPCEYLRSKEHTFAPFCFQCLLFYLACNWYPINVCE